MNELWLLKIECALPGIVYINGGIAGETPSANLCRYVSGGRTYLSFAPVSGEGGRVYIGFSRIIELSYDAPSITADDGTLSLYILPGSVCLVRLFPPSLPLPRTPYTLSSLDFKLAPNGRQCRAEVFYDFSFQFCLSEITGKILLACQLMNDVRESQLFLRCIGENSYLFAEIALKHGMGLLCISPHLPTLVFLEECAGYSFSENGVEIYFDVGDPYGYMLVSRRTFSIDGIQQEEAFCRHSQETAELSPSNTAAALVFALKYGNEELALSYLANSLRAEVTFEDLRDFFGEIGSVEQSFARPGELAISSPAGGNMFFVRMFAIEFSGNKISNISEQE